MKFCLFTLDSLLWNFLCFLENNYNNNTLSTLLKWLHDKKKWEYFVVSRIKFTKLQFKDNFSKKKQPRRGTTALVFLIRENFWMKLSLIVGLIEAVPQLSYLEFLGIFKCQSNMESHSRSAGWVSCIWLLIAGSIELYCC